MPVSREANLRHRHGPRKSLLLCSVQNGRQRPDSFLHRPEPNLALRAAVLLHSLRSLFNQTDDGRRRWVFAASETQLETLRYSWLPLVLLSEVGWLPDLTCLRFLIDKPGHAHLAQPPIQQCEAAANPARRAARGRPYWIRALARDRRHPSFHTATRRLA